MEDFGKYAKMALLRYADFRGRSRRAEFWWFVLASAAAHVVAAILDGVFFGKFGEGPFRVLLILALVIPSAAVAVRRLHDIGRTGWWMLIGFVPFVGWLVALYFYVQPGTVGPNRYGPDPTAEEPQPAVDTIIT